MDREAEEAEQAEVEQEGKPAESVGSAKMVWYKQIFLVAVVCALMVPLIWMYIDYDYHRAPRYIQPQPLKPIVYEGKINLQTGEFRLEKR